MEIDFFFCVPKLTTKNRIEFVDLWFLSDLIIGFKFLLILVGKFCGLNVKFHFDEVYFLMTCFDYRRIQSTGSVR